MACCFSWLAPSDRFCSLVGTSWSRGSLWAARIKLACDLGAVPKGSNVVFMANHQSELDILILYVALNRFTLNFIAKESLRKVPFLGWAMRAAGHVFVDRENRRKAMKSMDEAMERTKRGNSIVIFPEGTRNKSTDSLLDFQVGGMIIAIKCGLPIVPVIISGSGDIMPSGKKTLAPGKHHVRFTTLEPVQAGQYTLKQRDQLKDDLQDRMSQAYQRLRKETP